MTCPRCSGCMLLGSDQYGTYRLCAQCGCYAGERALPRKAWVRALRKKRGVK